MASQAGELRAVGGWATALGWLDDAHASLDRATRRISAGRACGRLPLPRRRGRCRRRHRGRRPGPSGLDSGQGPPRPDARRCLGGHHAPRRRHACPGPGPRERAPHRRPPRSRPRCRRHPGHHRPPRLVGLRTSTASRARDPGTRHTPAVTSRREGSRPRGRASAPTSPPPTSTCPSAAASRSPAPTAAASRRCSPCSPGTSTRPVAPTGSAAATRSTSRSSGRAPASPSSTTRPTSSRRRCEATSRSHAPTPTTQPSGRPCAPPASRPCSTGLPDGLDTPLGSSGRGLSGGERARLGIARAHVSRRPVVLLDEPAAHLDPPTARAVVEDLTRRRGTPGTNPVTGTDLPGQTIIMVTHRDDGADLFDRVVEVRRPSETVSPSTTPHQPDPGSPPDDHTHEPDQPRR